jgi:hypothetical protein
MKFVTQDETLFWETMAKFIETHTMSYDQQLEFLTVTTEIMAQAKVLYFS